MDFSDSSTYGLFVQTEMINRTCLKSLSTPWRNSSTYSLPRKYIEVSGQLHHLPLYPPLPTKTGGWVSDLENLFRIIWFRKTTCKFGSAFFKTNTLIKFNSFQQTFLFSPIDHNNIFITYITATCFGLFYRPDDVMYNRPKHVAVVIHITSILLCSMREKCEYFLNCDSITGRNVPIFNSYANINGGIFCSNCYWKVVYQPPSFIRIFCKGPNSCVPRHLRVCRLLNNLTMINFKWSVVKWSEVKWSRLFN
jgi:hypothetical protein